MLKKIPELFLVFPSIYSILKLIKQPNVADALIVGFLGLISVCLFYIRFKETSSYSKKSKEIQDLENKMEQERLRISIEELNYQANKNRVIRDNLEANKNRPNSRFTF